MTYEDKLKEVQKTFTDGIETLLKSHTRYIVNRYGCWKKYPRKIKKMLKKRGWWEIKNISQESIECIKVRVNVK